MFGIFKVKTRKMATRGLHVAHFSQVFAFSEKTLKGKSNKPQTQT